MSNRLVTPRNKESGQSFVELGMSLLFLLMLFSVMIELGFAFYKYISLRDTAQEAAAYGAICPFKTDGDGDPFLDADGDVILNDFLIKKRLQLSATSPIDMEDIDLDSIIVVFKDKTGGVVGSKDTPMLGGSITVEVTIDHKTLVPFFGGMMVPITAEVANTVLRDEWLPQCDY